MYVSCIGPFQTIMHWPYEGSMMDQPAVLVEFFELIRKFNAEKQENKSNKSDPSATGQSSVSEREAYMRRQRQMNRS